MNKYKIIAITWEGHEITLFNGKPWIIEAISTENAVAIADMEVGDLHKSHIALHVESL